jgi:hypothetical protein
MIEVRVIERHTLLSDVVIENADRDRSGTKTHANFGHRNESEKQAFQRPV